MNELKSDQQISNCLVAKQEILCIERGICPIAYSYATCVSVNGCYWNTCKLVFTITRARVLELVLMSVMSVTDVSDKY